MEGEREGGLRKEAKNGRVEWKKTGNPFCTHSPRVGCALLSLSLLTHLPSLLALFIVQIQMMYCRLCLLAHSPYV